jgi:hypothetical protein
LQHRLLLDHGKVRRNDIEAIVEHQRRHADARSTRWRNAIHSLVTR